MTKFALLVVPFVLLAAGHAQETVKAPPQPAKAAPQEPFVVDAGEVKLPALIDRCAAYLDCNIVWDAREMEAASVRPVRLQKAISADRDGCLEFLATSLHRHGFALTWVDEKGSALEVIAMVGPRGREVAARAVTRSEQDVLARPNLPMPVTVVLPLQHVNGVMAVNALRPVFAATGGPGANSLTLGTIGNTSMLLTGMQDRVAQAIHMVRELDKPPPGVEAAPPDAGKRIEQLEQRVAELEVQVKVLTDKLADAVKNRK